MLQVSLSSSLNKTPLSSSQHSQHRRLKFSFLMASDSGEHRRTTTAKNHLLGIGEPPPEPEHVPCPRCDSTNTKFCYYNNYNFSQPRHFCKSCRRYWTHGGALRDIPIGGGTRKSAKRARVSATTSRNNSPVSSGLEYHRISPTATTTTTSPMLLTFAGDHGGSGQCGGFMSLLSTAQSPGFFGLDQDLSFGLGRTLWPFSGIGDGVVAGHGGAGGGGHTWQVESGESDGECFVLPDLAISTPGNGTK